MPTPPDAAELDAVVAFVADEARKYLDAVGDAPVRDPDAEEVAASFGGSLLEDGIGAIAALEELVAGSAAWCTDGTALLPLRERGDHTGRPGRRLAHVDVGPEPRSVGLHAARRAPRVRGARLAEELFGLPAEWGGILTTGATMANFTALACARRWWGSATASTSISGLAGLPPMPVFASGYVHPS